MSCLPPSPTADFATALLAGLRAELDLSPKPGLVDRYDNGSHQDLSYPLMLRSLELLRTYFDHCVKTLEAGQAVERLRGLGIVAEARMFQYLGSNTHRGAIFLSGVLLGAVYSSQSKDPATVSDAVIIVAQRLLAKTTPAQTKGSLVRARYGTNGVLGEVLAGLPMLFKVAVPALQLAEQRHWPSTQGLFFAMAKLMQQVEDTTALRRCGPDGLMQLRRDGQQLESLLESGVDPRDFLQATNQQYQAMNLTMGGVADLLAMAAAWQYYTRVKV